MANGKRIKLLEQLRKVGMEEGADFLREGLKVMAEAFMELEVKEKTGAEPYQRSDERCNYRNGYREVLGHQGGLCAAQDTTSKDEQLLPQPARAQAPSRAGTTLSGSGGLCSRGEHQEGGDPGAGARA